MEKNSPKAGKAAKITYWIATIWLALGMLSTGIVQFIKVKEQTDMMNHLGYPVYFLTIIAIWKFLGVIVVLLPRFPLLKEWTYAGFFFAMSGAVISHLACGDGFKEIFGPALLIILIVVSWYFRPANRKTISSHKYTLKPLGVSTN
ncbi:DoxX family protein [Solitalea sp. MAHUQ-68]|uniref:DoxX family protein n=1 Tax=Solitalea agri TaxID=2953739 RepID=A0A9X2FCN1_9SPHI|nr:DoxX family protein [Solitalea agri]MCO4294433.1 DoxX family protein [Solitalea agri]